MRYEAAKERNKRGSEGEGRFADLNQQIISNQLCVIAVEEAVAEKVAASAAVARGVAAAKKKKAKPGGVAR